MSYLCSAAGLKQISYSRLIMMVQLALLTTACEKLDVYTRTGDLTFPDPVLTECVRDTGVEKGWQQAGRFTELRCNNAERQAIGNIEGLGTLIELVLLDLSFNQIEDPTPIAALPRLHELDLGHNKIVAFPIRSRSILQSMNLNYNRIQNLGWIRLFEDLQSLTVSHNQIDDISALTGVPELRVLDLSSNRVHDLRSLATLQKLRDLNLAHNSVVRVDELEKLFQLEVLNLAHNNITDLSVLSQLTNLVELNISHNPVSDLAPLAGLINLERIELNDLPALDLEPLLSLGRLEHISLRNIDDLNCNQIVELKKVFGPDALVTSTPCK